MVSMRALATYNIVVVQFDNNEHPVFVLLNDSDFILYRAHTQN